MRSSVLPAFVRLKPFYVFTARFLFYSRSSGVSQQPHYSIYTLMLRNFGELKVSKFFFFFFKELVRTARDSARTTRVAGRRDALYFCSEFSNNDKSFRRKNRFERSPRSGCWGGRSSFWKKNCGVLESSKFSREFVSVNVSKTSNFPKRWLPNRLIT